MENLNLLFNKQYYSNLGTPRFADDVKRINEKIATVEFKEKDYIKSKVANQQFIMKTCYPGLLIGIGNPHGAGKKLGEELDKKSDKKSDEQSKKLFGCNDDINCGFSFDYVTGQPYIPGSSVKGVLRSHFKEHPQAVADVVADVLKNNGVECDAEFVKALEKDIFDNKDVFLDAVIYDGDEHGNIVGFDYITPHESPLKDPIPIHIIKVLPDVKLEFRFRLSDHIVGDKTINGEDIVSVFLELLALFGIGAKTNVGYGVLEKSDESRSEKKPREADNTAANQTTNQNTNQSTNQSRNNNYRNNNRNNNAGGRNGDKIQCPHCNKYIFRINKFDGKPNKICYLCKEKLS